VVNVGLISLQDIRGMDLDKVDLLVPKEFPYSGNQADDYDIVGLDALVSGDVALDSVRAVAAAGHRKIGAEDIAKMPELEIIAKFGVGYDTIDVDAAARAGVVVTNTPDVLTDEVADLTVGLLIATVRKIPQAERFLRSGGWTEGGYPLSASLRNRKVGIAGLGRIGAAVGRRISAMDLSVSYYGRNKKT
jgi:lactate dehydrogenase-like 2-hydroxyacid dehydrogenase